MEASPGKRRSKMFQGDFHVQMENYGKAPDFLADTEFNMNPAELLTPQQKDKAAKEFVSSAKKALKKDKDE
jgi:hypothetical protein